MKVIFNILVLCLWFSFCNGQNETPVVDVYGQPVNYRVSALSSNIPLFLATDKNTKSINPFNPIPNVPLGSLTFLEGAQKILLTALVRKDSLSYYRYSVFENDTTLIRSNEKLSVIDFVWNERSDYPGYLTMKLELPNVVNKKFTIKIFRYPEGSKVTTLMIYNKRFEQAKCKRIFLQEQGKRIKTQITENLYTVDNKPLKNDTAFRIRNQTQGIRIIMQKTDLDFAYQLILKNKVNGKENIRFLSNNWSYESGNPGYFIPTDYFLTPGEYRLSIIPYIGSNGHNLRPIENKSFNMSFMVLPPPITYSIQEVILSLLALLLLGSILIFLIRKNTRKKLTISRHQAAAAETELENVRARLNPHFVFNALGGIQNLINKNEIASANSYLSKFARLTRRILNEEAKISLKDEIELLEDYIAMEQLRFPFKYKIQVNDELNSYTEIPTMLIQPFVENAVKHAIAPLKGKGEIALNFYKEENNLLITIADNGVGFTVDQEDGGLGLKLTKKRISLLNDLYHECPIFLTIESGLSGTTIKITLSQWL
ncbi:MAG: histidine kinase [Candidatus Pedobacter colombiensis]|uniref:Histidine kinase n=1 Tax=Candidatus Pedobacter colombiensis TaxID=3121371 RepID=A0AAJ5W4I3_9SPHI|nr:histidine kinase [Pedobacter sp.]WEK17827.1 MAG: histidine kinase [Pedobacter sp.]